VPGNSRRAGRGEKKKRGGWRKEEEAKKYSRQIAEV